MYQSCSNASGWYGGGGGLDDWSYPNFQVLGRPPPACRWLALPLESLAPHTEKRRGGWGGSAVKKGRRDAQIVGQRERDEGVKRGGGSIYRVSPRGPASPIAWPTRPALPSSSPSSHLALFPRESAR